MEVFSSIFFGFDLILSNLKERISYVIKNFELKFKFLPFISYLKLFVLMENKFAYDYFFNI